VQPQITDSNEAAGRYHGSRLAAPTSRLSSDTGYVLWRAGKLAANAARGPLQALGVRPRQFVVLAFCDDHGPASQRTICDALGLDPSAAPDDRRVRLIVITAPRRAFRACLHRHVEEAIARMLRFD